MKQFRQCSPQLVREHQREIRSVERYHGRMAHLTGCFPNRTLPSLSRPYVGNATEPVLFRADAGEFASDASWGTSCTFVAQPWNRRPALEPSPSFGTAASFEHRRLANL